MIDELSYDQLLAWAQYDEVDPFGSVRSDLQLAIVAQSIVNTLVAVNTVKGRPKSVPLSKFMVGELLRSSRHDSNELTAERWSAIKSNLKNAGRTINDRD